MSAPGFVLRDVVNNDGLAALADFMANCRFDIQFVARLQTELNLIADTAGDPAVLGHARNRREPHSRYAADNVEDRGDRLNAAHTLNIGSKVSRKLRLWVQYI